MTANGAGPAPTFAPGDVVAGRYSIASYLGQGSAGEVYGAQDLQLRSRVALKVLRPAASRDPQSIERFKREILLARRVSHPNVCRIFDLGVHERSEPGPDGERSLLFLTMEWLEGETLARRIQESGPFDEAPALAVVRQLCSGLSAAHAAGVVHRDFKSSNILLVSGRDGERAVITDFGLARSQHQSAEGGALTEVGGLLGTPAYMSPEQVSGLAATPASDLYALGVVLYEMLTGSLPFHGESPLEVAVKRLREAPTPLALYRSGISERFRAAVDRCLEREPERRFASPEELLAALDPPTRVLRPERAPLRRWLGGAAAGAVLAAALLFAVRLWQSASPESPTSRGGEGAKAALAPARRAIAVLGFANTTGRPEAQWLSSALSEMLTSELAASGAVRAVPGEVVAQARQDLGLALSSSLGAESLGRLKRILGADLVLLGSFTAQGGSGAPLRVDLRLQATDGSFTRPFYVEGSEATIFDLVRQSGTHLRRELGIESLPAAAVPALDRSHPASPEAVRLYASGLEALRSFEPGRARELLERAIVADPDFPLAYAAIADAWSDLGFDDRALAAAGEAHRRAGSLARSEQLQVEGLERRLSRDWPRATEIAATLWRFYPDDLEQGLRLAEVQLEAGASTAALGTVGELRLLPPPSGEDPRIDLVEAEAAGAISDFRRQLEVAERAAARAEAAGSRSILARARFAQAGALRKLGDSARAAELLEATRRLADELGDRAYAAVAAQALANLEQARGNFDRADRLYEQARLTFAEIGNRRRAARIEIALGLLASERGDLGAARGLYERAEAALGELGDLRGRAAAAANLGTMLYLQWDLAGAEQRHEQALASFRQLGDRSRELVSLANLGQIRRERGDLEGSDRLWQQALTFARATGDQAGEGDALLGLGENRVVAGDPAAAASHFSAALALFEAGGERPRAAAVRLEQARLQRDAGEAEKAFAALVALAAEFAARGEGDEKVQADLEAARCLLAQRGKSTAAAELVSSALSAAESHPAAWLRHLGRQVSAELDLAFGRNARARRTLDEDRALAEKAGHRLALLEARLGLLAIDRAEDRPEAQAKLLSFAAETRAAGLGALAARAELLARPKLGRSLPPA